MNGRYMTLVTPHLILYNMEFRGAYMETMLLLAQELLILYGISLIGFVAKRTKVLSEHADAVLTQLILYITLPALILYSMSFSFSSAYFLAFGQLILLSAYALAMAILFAFFLSRNSYLEDSKSGVYQSLMIFGNQGFIGFAVCFLLFAEQGVVYAAAFNILYLLLIWTYCPYLIGNKQALFTWKGFLLNPGILATFAGLVLSLLSLPLPSSALTLLENVGKMTIPLSMLLIGGLLANLKWKELYEYIRDYHLWFACLVKLVLFPLLLLPAFLLPIPPIILFIAIIITASPSAPTTTLFAQKYQGEFDWCQ